MEPGPGGTWEVDLAVSKLGKQERRIMVSTVVTEWFSHHNLRVQEPHTPSLLLHVSMAHPGYPTEQD